jgi:hypothetical protein
MPASGCNHLIGTFDLRERAEIRSLVSMGARDATTDLRRYPRRLFL